MALPRETYQSAAQVYSSGVRRLFSPIEPPAATRGLERREAGTPAEIIAGRAQELAPVSRELTGAAAVRLDDQDPAAREEASLQLISKALVDLQVSQYLLDAAQREEGGAGPAGPLTRGFAEERGVPDVDEYLAVILGQPARPVTRGVGEREIIIPVDVITARIQLNELVLESLRDIEKEAAETSHGAIGGLLSMGLGQVTQAGLLIRTNITGTFAVAEKVSQLYGLFREFFANAFDSILALLGPSLASIAKDKVISWVGSILNSGETIAGILDTFYRTKETHLVLGSVVNHSEASLEKYVTALQLVDSLRARFAKQSGYIRLLVQGLRAVSGIPAVALPQVQLVIGAAYILVTGYAVFAGADYVDAPGFTFLDRVAGPRKIVLTNLGPDIPKMAAPPEVGAGELPAVDPAAPPHQHAKPPAVGAEPPEEVETAEPVPPRRDYHPPAAAPAAPPREVREEGLAEEKIRLDMAVPDAAVTVGETFEVAVAIRRPRAAKLALDGLKNVVSGLGSVFRRQASELVRYRVKITAPDCKIESSEYVFQLRPNRDSEPYFFQLTPQKPGTISVLVTAFQEDDMLLVAQTRVRLQAAVQAVAASAEDSGMGTNTRASLLAGLEKAAAQPPDARPVDKRQLLLYQAMKGPAFTTDDLQDVAFQTNVDWDLLEGENKPAKARSLILFLASRDQLDQLYQVVKDARPNLNLP